MCKQAFDMSDDEAAPSSVTTAANGAALTNANRSALIACIMNVSTYS